MGRFRFSGKERIRKGTEIRGLLQGAPSVSCRGMKLYWLPSESASSRLAIALKRGYGTAVRRNRAKRLLRESYRTRKRGLGGTWDILVLMFPGEDQFSVRDAQFSRLLHQAGLTQ